MIRFSANLGYLWSDLPLPEAIRRAAEAGFDAVECQWPYQTPAAQVRAALDEAGLPVMGLNTRRGAVEAGERGLCALPGRRAEARDAIDEALDYAVDIGARNIHVMAGISVGPEAHDTFVANLRHACERAAEQNRTILIEPLNRHDAPGYFLRDTAQAAGIIAEVCAPNLKLMFDCYHVGRTEGDVLGCLAQSYPIIGHIQFASVPDRGPPDRGEVDYRAVFDALEARKWPHPLGAEYRPRGDTAASLGWMADLTASA